MEFRARSSAAPLSRPQKNANDLQPPKLPTRPLMGEGLGKGDPGGDFQRSQSASGCPAPVFPELQHAVPLVFEERVRVVSSSDKDSCWPPSISTINLASWQA